MRAQATSLACLLSPRSWPLTCMCRASRRFILLLFVIVVSVVIGYGVSDPEIKVKCSLSSSSLHKPTDVKGAAYGVQVKVIAGYQTLKGKALNM